MSSNEEQAQVGPDELLAGLTFSPLPEGTKAEAVFVLVKLDSEAGDGKDEWCVRTTGEYNRLEFLGALMSYVHAQRVDEAMGWMDDEDD